MAPTTRPVPGQYSSFGLTADLLDALKAFCGDHEATGFACVGLNAAYLQAMAVIARAENWTPFQTQATAHVAATEQAKGRADRTEQSGKAIWTRYKNENDYEGAKGTDVDTFIRYVVSKGQDHLVDAIEKAATPSEVDTKLSQLDAARETAIQVHSDFLVRDTENRINGIIAESLQRIHDAFDVMHRKTRRQAEQAERARGETPGAGMGKNIADAISAAAVREATGQWTVADRLAANAIKQKRAKAVTEVDDALKTLTDVIASAPPPVEDWDLEADVTEVRSTNGSEALARAYEATRPVKGYDPDVHGWLDKPGAAMREGVKLDPGPWSHEATLPRCACGTLLRRENRPGGVCDMCKDDAVDRAARDARKATAHRPALQPAGAFSRAVDAIMEAERLERGGARGATAAPMVESPTLQARYLEERLRLIGTMLTSLGWRFGYVSPGCLSHTQEGGLQLVLGPELGGGPIWYCEYMRYGRKVGGWGVTPKSQSEDDIVAAVYDKLMSANVED